MNNLKNLMQNSKQAWSDTLARDDVTVSSRVYIANDSIKDIRMSNGRKYGQRNEITVYGE